MSSRPKVEADSSQIIPNNPAITSQPSDDESTENKDYNDVATM